MWLWKIKVTSEKRLVPTLWNRKFGDKSSFSWENPPEAHWHIKSSEACDRRNPGRQQIHSNCKAFVRCSVVQGSQSGLLSLPFSGSYTQTWSSWFKLALSCCTPATALFCLLWQGKKLPPLLARPSSSSVHSQSLLFSISGHRQSPLAMSAKGKTL